MPAPDRIFIRDHVIEVEIGAFQQERGIRQRIRFAVDVDLRPHAAPLDDDVDRILSYDRITEAIAAELATERLNLLETLAENVARRILAAPQAGAVTVRIEKLDRGPFVLGVEITRSRADVDPVAADAARARVMLAQDWGGAADGGTILVPDFPDLPRLQVGEADSQRRIDLLALEQAAWALAARDARLSVAASRTEIDWAMRHGHVTVWAPSRMVLDAVDGPDLIAPEPLAAWLAREIGAEPSR